MAKAFYFNMTYCTGCKACQVACKDKNNLPLGVLYRHIESYEVGKFPNPGAFHYSQTCHHCEEPACVVVCPVGAMVKTEDGPVIQNQEKCIGCQSCVKNCPYGVPQYIEEQGVSGKCDSCVEIRNEGGLPQCVAACPMRALDFGEYDELLARHGDAVSISEIAVVPASETHPMTLSSLREIASDATANNVVY